VEALGQCLHFGELGHCHNVRMTYTHGHHESVLRSHTWRTAGNSAAYLLPHLRPGQSLLDIGCGPGTITADLARLVAPGAVVGLDASAEVLARAGEHAAGLGLPNLRFEEGDLFALRFADASFDVVHVHQVLQHLVDPVAALVELRRVLQPGGLLAVRESDYGAFTWAPADPALDRWLALYLDVTSRNGHDALVGRRLLALAHRAGFIDVTVSSTTWTFADPESRAWWGGLWADRVRYSRFAEQAVGYGLSGADELEALAAAFSAWAASDDGVFVVPHVEILARP
jgi:SAM-dependent methyltransferase